ncbi:MBL fold metallo-hydrolase [Solicola gregarius]|uniref:MBL fold metallo-hydrolase n=1 Tax=Solicola gregarius TaxID=2908642 RepID=A0AA46THY8_9ACTN|nr:MBL fold metallo-hydrolase [Solicola gregarius]UYM05162.1 MBL fold metallo-hydrolase [Solicola gregarius]
MEITQASDSLHLVSTRHVNWVIYDGPDGLLLIDAGYVGQRDLLERSIRELGHGPDEIAAALVTHGHVDHIGGLPWLATRYGTPVYSSEREAAHIRREFLEQAGPPDIVRNLTRPGVLTWSVQIVGLMRGRAGLGVPSAEPIDEATARTLPGSPRPIVVTGHTTGHTAYYFEAERVLVAGDAITTEHATSRVQGPQLLPEFFHHDPSQALASLNELADLEVDTVLPGHGPPTPGPMPTVIAQIRDRHPRYR